MHARHRVLQLITKAECATGLIETAAGENAACDNLVGQPTVHHYVELWIGRFHLHGRQHFMPVHADAIERIQRRTYTSSLCSQLACGASVVCRTEPERDFN